MNKNRVINYLDHLSMQPKLFIRGNKRYSTTFGVFMTIISFSAILIFGILFLSQFFDKKQMNVIYYSQNIDSNEYDYDFNKKIFAFQLNDGYNIVDPRYLTTLPILAVRNLSSNTVNRTIMEYEVCEPGKNIDYKYWNITGLKEQLTGLYCIKPDIYNIRLANDPIKKLKTFFSIYIQMCQNSTQNNNSCYPKEKIIEYLKKAPLSVIYYYHSYKIDLLNKENPLQDYYIGQRSSFFLDFKYVFYEFIKPVRFESDAGIFFDATIGFNNFGRDDIKSYIEINPPTTEFSIKDTVFLMQFVTSNFQIDIYIRTYIKFQTLIANIGGIMKFLMWISQMITNYVTYEMFIYEMSQTYIDNHNEKDKEIMRKNSKEVIKTTNFYLQSYLNKSELNKMKLDKNFELEDVKGNKIKIDVGNSFKKQKPIKVNYSDAIIPYWLCQSRKKFIANQGEKIILKMISSDTLMKNHVDFEKLKSLIFTKNQHELFNLLKNQNFEEHLKIFDQDDWNWKKIEKIIKQESEMQDHISKGIINRILNLNSDE